MIKLASITKELIDNTLYETQGGAYRVLLQKWFNTIEDAYKANEGKSHRTHLGCSVIGKNCDKAIWLGYRWVKDIKFPGRLNLLFNTGHIYEARFCALLEMIGCEVLQYDKETGRQFGVSNINGHYRGSGDGIAYNVPDLPKGECCLLEFKTHGSKSYSSLSKKGVQIAKPEHFIQMQQYLEMMGLKYALYIGVNKDTDDLHLEIIEHESYVAKHFLERAERIIYSEEPPKPVADSPVAKECQWCDYVNLCHRADTTDVDMNCRSCSHSYPSKDESLAGEWMCGKFNAVIPKEKSLYGCKSYEMRKLW